MPQAQGTKGNKKKRKTDQPKRRRYVVEHRGRKRRIRDLERHIKRHPLDAIAVQALPRLRKELLDRV